MVTGDRRGTVCLTADRCSEQHSYGPGCLLAPSASVAFVVQYDDNPGGPGGGWSTYSEHRSHEAAHVQMETLSERRAAYPTIFRIIKRTVTVVERVLTDTGCRACADEAEGWYGKPHSCEDGPR